MAVSALTVDQLTQLVQKTVQEEIANSVKQTPLQPSSNTSHHATTPQYIHRNQGSPPQRVYQQNGYATGYGYPRYIPTHTMPQSPHSPYSSTTPRGPGPTHQYPYQNRRTYNTATMQQIRIMVTYVETACTLWGQVLTPDLIDTHKQLEDDLSEICPLLPPTQLVAKSSIYGTLWDNTWYRCISCCGPDPDGNVEVLFVDFGNKERRNLSELVYLRTPKLLDVPFLACPFQFQNMVAVTDKQLEAIGYFNTTDILTGIVTKTPSSKEYTDITLIRPLNSTSEQPETTTYNALMLQLGYTKKSESVVENRSPQPHYYVQGLNHRVRKLQLANKEKDDQLTKLYKMIDGEGQEGQEVDIVGTPALRCSPTIPRPPRTSLMASVNSHIAGPVVTNSHTAAPSPSRGTNSLTQTDLEMPEAHELIEDQLQTYLDELVLQLENYSKYDDEGSKEGDNMRSLYNKLASCTIPAEIVSLKGVVDKALAELNCSRTRILDCRDPQSLEEAVKQRDTTLQLISQHITVYIEKVEEVRLEDVVATIKQVKEELGVSKPVAAVKPAVGSRPTLGDTIQELIAMEEDQKEGLDTLQGQCSEQLTFLAEQFLSYSNIISACNAQFSEPECGDASKGEQLQKLLLDVHKIETEKENVTAVGCNIAATKALLADITDMVARNKAHKAPLLSRLGAQLLSTADRSLQSILPYISCCEDLQSRAKLASETLANKPDMSTLREVKAQLKTAKRKVKLVQIKDEDSDEEGNTRIRECMVKLHELYEREEGELSKLANLARTTHPELLVEHPQLNNMTSAKNRIIKCGWELHEFVLPDTVASINSNGHNVYCGFYCQKDIYLVERILLSVSDSLDVEALGLLSAGQLSGCFAIFIDRQRLRAIGATEVPPI